MLVSTHTLTTCCRNAMESDLLPRNLGKSADLAAKTAGTATKLTFLVEVVTDYAAKVLEVLDEGDPSMVPHGDRIRVPVLPV